MNNDFAETQEFGVTFARLIAAMAVDPHGYFEKKYTARIENSQSIQEIQSVVAQLVAWIGSSAVTEKERDTLDQELGRNGLPSIEALRDQYLP